MSILYINARCKQMLQILASQPEHLSVNRIAQAMGVSRRTVYYDVDKINLWLVQSGLPILENERDKGLLLSKESRELVWELLRDDVEEQVYLFSPEERVKCIVCYIIYAKKQVYIEQLMECFGVSRNTIFNDLKLVTEQLEQYELKLDYKPKQGYRIEGDAVRVRALFMMYFSEMEPLFRSGSVYFFDVQEVQAYYESMKEIEKKLEITYVEGVLFSVAALVPLLKMHRREVYFPGLKNERIQKTIEYALVEKYFPDLQEEEQVYLTMHLLGSRVNVVPDDFFESNSNAYIYDMVRALICEFEKVACITFENKDELERALFVHLNTSLYRYRFGIQIGNVFGDDVIREYPDLFAITKIAIKNLEASIGMPIADSEIAYLALHFGSFLKISDNDSDHLRILIVCVNGVATGNMIRREVQKLLPFAEIIDVVAAVNMMNPQRICDLIISTVRINSVVPVITVNPILSELDKKNILHHRLVEARQVELQREKIFSIVKKYVPEKDHSALLQDLTAYLQGKDPDIQEGREFGLMDILREEDIGISDEFSFWQQSIRMAGKPLLRTESIRPAYLDKIVEQLQYYGPYMFLTDDVILAHANPTDGVNALGVSMMCFRKPVVFTTERKARLVIVLAAEDQEKHLRILQDIITLLDSEHFMEKLDECKTSVEILKLIGRLLKA